jgi:uncharacterized protein (TIGR02145 family)
MGNVSTGAYYWSSTESSSSYAYELGYYSGNLYVSGTGKYCGQQVRCVK